MKLKSLHAILAGSLVASSMAYANISGTVFRDYNINATQDTLEPGLSGITVNAYDNSGAVAATATTDANGAFDLATGAGNYRVEVVKPSYLYDTANGASTASKPSTFTAADGDSDIKVGVHNPADYVSTNAKVISAVYSAGSLAKAADNPSIKAFAYDPNKKDNTDSADVISKTGDTGTLWGLAYDPTNKKAYLGATLKRHAAVGPEGLGAIYVVDYSDPANTTTSLFTKVDNAGTEPGNRDLDDPNTANHDPDILPVAAKVGLGDVDLSEDGKSLYTINLNTQELVKIDIASKAQTTTAIANPFGANCPDTDVKSWGLAPHDGAVYVGSVCSSDVSVGAAVSKYDGSSFTTVFTAPLNYERESTLEYDVDNSKANWHAWNDTLSNGQFDVDPSGYGRFQDAKVAQPILSDIVFTEESGMVLGFIDRTTMQTGFRQYGPTNDNVYEYDAGGDTLRVCKVGSDYKLEGDAACPTHQDSHSLNEYFVGDYYSENGNYIHNEVTTGGLLHKQGAVEIGTSAFDPNDNPGERAVNRSGVKFLSMDSGNETGGQLLNGEDTSTQAQGGFGKTGGIGDIELMSDPAPIEIGNYVWFDANGNGIQDPDESGIAGVKVDLYAGDTKVGTATTDADGYYYFGGAADTNGHVNPNTDYQLRIDLADAALGGKSVTAQDSTTDNADSDGDNGVLNAGFSTIAYKTEDAGQNNHDLDFGFTEVKTYCLGDYVWEDTDQDGTQNESSTGIKSVTVKLYKDGAATGDTTETDDSGAYKFCGLQPGKYSVEFDKTTLPADYVITQKDAGGDDAKDSDADTNSGKTAEVEIVDADNMTLDMGIYKPDVPTPAIDIEKATNGKDADTAADAYEATPNEDITWTYVVKNTGTEDLKDVAVVDDKGVTVDCGGVTTLAVGKSMTCTGTGKATKSTYENKGTVTAKGKDSNKDVTDEDPSHYKVVTAPAIDIEKATNGKDADTAADAYEATPNEAITWSYVVTNTGTEDLKEIVAGDDKEGTITCPQTTLAVGKSMTCTSKSGTAPATTSEYENIASVQGTGTISGDNVTDEDPSHYKVTFVPDPSIDLEKHTNGVDADEPTGPLIPVGGSVTWTYIVTNTGNEKLLSLKIVDDKVGDITCSKDSLDVNETMTCEAGGVAVEGQYENNAKVTANGEISDKEVTDEDPSHYFGLKPTIDLEKHTNGKDADTQADAYEAAPNEDIKWEYIVTNTGNEKLVNIKVADDKEGDVTAKCPATELEVGANMTCTLTGKKATVAKYTNNATVTADGETSKKQVDDKDPSNYVVKSKPEIDIEKHTNGKDADTAADAYVAQPGEKITWEYILTNNGNEKLVDIAVSDDKEGTVGSCPSTELEVGATMTCTLTSTATVTEYENNSKVTAKGAITGTTVDDDDPSHYKIDYTPKIDIEKHTNGVDADEPTGPQIPVGDSVTWTYIVTNTGNEALKDVKVVDDKVGDINCSKTSLDVNETMTCEAGGTAVAGQYENNAKVTGKGVNSDKPVEDADPSHYFGLKPSITIDKHTNGVDADTEAENAKVQPNDTITWEYIITNDGNEKLVNIKLEDDKEGDVTAKCPATELEVGATMTCTLTGKATVYKYRNNSKVTADGELSGTTVKHEDPSGYEVPDVCLGDYIWLDTNADGIQDADEVGVDGAVVILKDTAGNPAKDVDGNIVMAQETTGGTGLYKFCKLEPFKYYHVEVIPPNGYMISPKNQGEDDAKDSDISPKTQVSDSVYLEEDNMTLDAGLYEPACIGDVVWHDKNANGIQDADEKGVRSAKVELFDKDGKPVYGANGEFIEHQTTGQDGKYLFCGLIPNDYKIKVTPPEGYYISPKDKSGDAADKDVDANTNDDSDIDLVTGETTLVNLKSGEDDRTWDAGLFKPACMGDYFWNDKNADGIQDADEKPLEGVAVELFDKDGKRVVNVDGTTVAPQSTLENGKYEFCQLVPGDYYIKATPPSTTFHISPKDSGNDDAKDSDIDPATGKTVPTNLESGEKDPTWDGGMFESACIGDKIWLDKNGNGIQDSGEEGVAGATVTVLNADGSKVVDINGHIVAPTVTKADGIYHECDLPVGNYKVKVTPPAGYLITLQDKGSDDAKDSDMNPATGETVVTELVGGEDDRTWDAGLFKPACIGDYVWHDHNANGVQDTNDEGIAGAKVELLTATGDKVIDVTGTHVEYQTTGNDGLYKFCQLRPGDYKIRVVKPEGNWYLTFKDLGGDDAKDSDVNKATKETIVTDLESGENDMTWDVGMFKPACIGDYVWEDMNGNGIQDEGEPSVKGATVKLYGKTIIDSSYKYPVTDADALVKQDVLTDDKGHYSYCQLIPGSYKVEFITPEGMKITHKANIGDDDKVDSDPDPKTGVTEPTFLESDENDTTWDAGMFVPACIGDYVWEDMDANGIQDENATGVANVEMMLVDENGDSVVDADFNTVANMNTAADGKYQFCNLHPAKYHVKMVVPEGYFVTREDKGTDDANDSDFKSFLAKGAEVVETENTMLLSREHDMTWDAGVFKPACLGDYTWKDTNVDGIQDESEEPLVGVRVQVLDQNGSTVTDVYSQEVTEILTDDSGKYNQCNLIPGSYVVKFTADPDENGLPYLSTKGDQGEDDSADSDIPSLVKGGGSTEPVTIESGENNTTLDAGFIQEICLGDYVWFDENLNGIQDKGELGVRDIPVTLTYANGKAVTDVYGNPVKASKTDKKGYYKFCHLTPATDYNIKFKIPESYNATKVNQGSDLKDSDAGKDGVIKVKNPVKDDLTLDMGIYCDCDDYQVNPEGYKELKMPALNVLGLLAMVTAVFVLVRRED